MSKCTLKEVVELCRKNGGYFYGPADLKWEVNEGGFIKNAITGDDFYLHGDDFIRYFEYEPPESEFQKSLLKADPKTASEKVIAKIMWNEALEAVLNLPPHNSLCDRSTEKIADLKQQ